MAADLDSMFKTKVNWQHSVGPFKKMQKQEEELQEATFYKVLEQYADSKLMRASRRYSQVISLLIVKFSGTCTVSSTTYPRTCMSGRRTP